MQFGAAPTSRAGLGLVGAASRLLLVDPDDLVADPHGRAERRFAVRAGPARACRDRPAPGPTLASAWIRTWVEADDRARDAVDATIDGWDEPYEGRIARDVAASAPDGSSLVVGSSMPVRDLDAYMASAPGAPGPRQPGSERHRRVRLDRARRLGGRRTDDGALRRSHVLHDVGSLIWSASRGYDCVFVVPNNDGGVIFSFLPQRELPELEELFTTPHGLDLGAVCVAAGAGHVRVERAADLIPAVERAHEARGVHVVEVPIDRARNVELHAEVQAAVAGALDRPTCERGHVALRRDRDRVVCPRRGRDLQHRSSFF